MSEGGRLDADTAFALLSNERRREILYLLASEGEELPLQTVATEVIERVNETDANDIDDKTYRSVYVSLYQNHVPRLAAAGVIHYDEDRRTIRIAHNERTQTLLELLGIDSRRNWRRAYLLLAASVLVVGIGSVNGYLPTLTTPVVLPAIVLIVGLTLIGGLQHRRRHRVARVTDRGELSK